jgi:hypothetical protein
MIEYSTIAPYLFVDDAPAVEEFMKNKATLTKINNKEFVLDVASIGTYRLQSRQQAIAMILSLLDVREGARMMHHAAHGPVTLADPALSGVRRG